MEKSRTDNNKAFFPLGMKRGQKILIWGILLSLLAYCYIIVKVGFKDFINLPAIPFDNYGGRFIPPLLAIYLYFAYTRGWKSMLIVVMFTYIYVVLAEELSIYTGFPFGNYYYTIGPKLDKVPVILGLIWFYYFVFPCYFVSKLIVEGKPFGLTKGTGKLIFTAFIGGILAAGIDMVIDPVLATRFGEWVWTSNSHTGYYGIPYINYLGYVIVLIPAYFLIGLLERKLNAKPMGPVNLFIGAIPLFFYFQLFLYFAFRAPRGVLLVGCFTMGLPLLLAADKLIKYFSGKPQTD
ncbi:MAG: carotenoid biosynthesis protein [Candidatus Omnitrophota bacterium]